MEKCSACFGSSGLGLGLGLVSSGFGLDTRDLVNITARNPPKVEDTRGFC